jgi:hypothetical protein
MSSGMLRHIIWYKFTYVSEVLACCLHRQGVLMMEAESISEMSVNFYKTTRRNIPEDSYHHPLPCPQDPATSPYPEPD